MSLSGWFDIITHTVPLDKQLISTRNNNLSDTFSQNSSCPRREQSK